MTGMVQSTFSRELESWLKQKGPKTLGSLVAVFKERSFAIIILVLMAFPALPLPTGGITHVFELITMLIAGEMVVGMHGVWLPRSWLQKELGPFVQGKFIPYLIRRVRWFERFSRPRFNDLLQRQSFGRITGGLLLLFALGAFLAPPFSGLDTLPALGAVMLALSLILGDITIFAGGIAVGAIGLGLVLAFGTVTVDLIKHFF